ncbi:MAG TPA: hypothetical protein VN843_18920, partial [Anaerolineales bacterium]|nr:hypothetical protein [Anaerolineales bacterium]
MIIFGRGIGFVVLLIAILACLITNIVTSKAFDETNYFQAHLWPKVGALWLTGVCCYFLGRYVHGQPPKLVIDERTGQEIEQKPVHDLMMIKVEYWGFIFVGIGVVLILV